MKLIILYLLIQSFDSFNHFREQRFSQQVVISKCFLQTLKKKLTQIRAVVLEKHVKTV